MKILFTRFPLESALGGAELQTIALMEELTRRGHAVVFAGSCPTLLALCREKKIPAAEWHIGPPPVTKWSVLSLSWRRFGMRKKLRALLEQFADVDVLCMLSLSEKLLLTEAATKRGKRVYWIEHDTVGRWLTKNPWLSLLKKQSKAAVTITVSELSRKLYCDLGWDPGKVIAIPNGVDATRLGSPLLRERQQRTDPLRLGCIARLSPEKGVDLLIRALLQLPPAVTLEIVGEGKAEKSLHALVAALHLEKRIVFSSPQRNVRQFYERFDAVILPSREHDPFGLAVAEAMTLGLPTIVTTACGVASSLLPGSDALIVKVDSVSALTEAIQELLDPATYLRLVQNGKATAREKFSFSSMATLYEAVFTGSPRS